MTQSSYAMKHDQYRNTSPCIVDIFLNVVLGTKTRNLKPRVYQLYTNPLRQSYASYLPISSLQLIPSCSIFFNAHQTTYAALRSTRMTESPRRNIFLICQLPFIYSDLQDLGWIMRIWGEAYEMNLSLFTGFFPFPFGVSTHIY